MCIIVSLGCTGLDMTFIIDSSGSIKRENWPKVLNFAASITQSLLIGLYYNRVSAVSHALHNNVTFHELIYL